MEVLVLFFSHKLIIQVPLDLILLPVEPDLHGLCAEVKTSIIDLRRTHFDALGIAMHVHIRIKQLLVRLAKGRWFVAS